MPRFSIIIINKNEVGIADTLRSIYTLADTQTEIIVVDASHHKLDAIYTKFPKIKLFDFKPKNPQKASIPEQRNFGIAQARSDIIIFLDASCVPDHPDWLSRLTDPIVKEHEAIVRGSLSNIPNYYTVAQSAGDKVYVTEAPTINLAIRKSVFREIGLFDESFAYGSDMDFTWRATHAGLKIRYVAAASVSHDFGSTKSNAKRYLNYGKARAKLYLKHPYYLSRMSSYEMQAGLYLLAALLLPIAVLFPWYLLLPAALILIQLPENVIDKTVERLAFGYGLMLGVLQEIKINIQAKNQTWQLYPLRKKSLQQFAVKFHQNRLLSNSVYLMISTMIMSLTGFFFWIVNTKFYSAAQIGLATTFISVVTLLTSFSMFGLNIALVRFLPTTKHKNGLINVGFSIIVLVSIVLSLIFVLGLPIFSQPLDVIINNPLSVLLFIAFIAVAALNMITDSVFISLGTALYSLIVNTVLSVSKFLLAVILTGLGVMGIIYSFTVSTVIAAAISFAILFLKLNYKVTFTVKWPEVKNMWTFTFGNYLSSILGSVAGLLTPLIITSKLSPEFTAYYYMPTMIAALLLTVPRSTVSSLIAEGSREKEPLKKLTLRSLTHIYFLVIPACAVIFIFGGLILTAFGKNYSTQGIMYLRLLLVSILLSVPGFLAGAIINIKKKISLQLIANLLNAGLSLGLNVILLSRGLVGLGLASILTQVIMTGVYFVMVYRFL